MGVFLLQKLLAGGAFIASARASLSLGDTQCSQDCVQQAGQSCQLDDLPCLCRASNSDASFLANTFNCACANCSTNPDPSLLQGLATACSQANIDVPSAAISSASAATCDGPSPRTSMPTVTLGGTLPLSGEPGSISRTLPYVGGTLGPSGASGSLPGIGGTVGSGGVSGSIPGVGGTVGPGGVSGCVWDLCGSLTNPFYSLSPTTLTTSGTTATVGVPAPASVSPQPTTPYVTTETQTSTDASGSTVIIYDSLTVSPTGTTALGGVSETLFGSSTLTETSTTTSAGTSITGTGTSGGASSGALGASPTSSVNPFPGGARPAAEGGMSGPMLSLIVAVLGAFGLL